MQNIENNKLPAGERGVSLDRSVPEAIECIKDGYFPSIMWNWRLVKPIEVKALFFLSFIA